MLKTLASGFLLAANLPLISTQLINPNFYIFNNKLLLTH